ncbi:MAG: ABC transporter permease subunit [Pseudomonadota bacterium]|nr:ABC transporter permease subunit [Pseudomonadota bacterium]
MTDLNTRVPKFVQHNSDYYAGEFNKIQHASKGKVVWSWNVAAACGGSLWAAWRRLWGFFWLLLLLELLALVLISKAIWGIADSDLALRHQKLLVNIATRQQQLQEASADENQAAVEVANRVIANLQRVATKLELQMQQQSNDALLYFGIVMLLMIRLFAGFSANRIYQKKYLRWRLHPALESSGCSWKSSAVGVAMLMAIVPLTIFRFVALNPDKTLARFSGGWLGETITITKFPLQREIFNYVARLGDAGFAWLTAEFGHVFDGVVNVVVAMLGWLEIVLLKTPWPVVMLMLVVMAFRLAGVRVAIFTAMSLAYLALFGLWEIAMITVALIGASAGICIVLGIPIGIWFGRNARAYRIAEPVLDFMQTMPTFVYLIPIIAFFGTGKPPGVLVTIIFAIPPIIRLTALGIQSVPDDTQEAAIAFGCSSWQLLWKVQLPLATPSIMTGINQTILMSLSMVVIASLIGAEGLGALILEALQYAAKGQGLLAGLAILLCAMVMDRIAQGYYRRKHRLSAQ